MRNATMTTCGKDACGEDQEPAKTSSKASGERVFHIDAVNIRTGMRARMTGYPMPERQCRTMMGKITRYRWRRLELVEARA